MRCFDCRHFYRYNAGKVVVGYCPRKDVKDPDHEICEEFEPRNEVLRC